MIDFVALAKNSGGAIDVTTPDTVVAVERADSSLSYPRWPDIWLQYDLDSTGGSADSPVLAVENAGGNPYDLTFVPEAFPSGSTTDWFRYRVDQSSSPWINGETSEPAGDGIARLWWDAANNPNDRSGFFDSSPDGGRFLRIFQYKNIVSAAPTSISIGLEIMRPDEPPASSPTITQSATITSVTPLPPQACWEPESFFTWRKTDQYLDASCSSGNDIEYSWDIGSGYGPYTSNPILESFGYPTAGGKTVRLRVRDISYSPPTVGFVNHDISVSSPLHAVYGPEYVTNKQLKTYEASASSSWWERYDPPSTLTWYLMLSPSSSYNRIWAAGSYTRGLRARRLSGSGLARGRIDVVVCHESIPGCSPPPPEEVVAGGSFNSLAPSTASEWGLFGAGPWVSSSGQVARFYDLTGLHEAGSPFSTTAWLEKDSGSATSARVEVTWRQLRTLSPNVKIVTFIVRPTSPEPYRFGMALDPDLGDSPTDDKSGYDSASQLLFAVDGSNAVGFNLESLDGSAVRTIEQYGTERFAPRAADEAQQVGNVAGVRLSARADDVQFVVMGDEQTGVSRWRLVIVRGSSVGDLQSGMDSIAAE